MVTGTGPQEALTMRILVVGAGGVGSAVVGIAARRTFFEAMIVADYDVTRAERAVASTGDPRFVAARVDASDEAAVAALLREHRCDAMLNATDPRFVMPLFRAALAAGTHYLDMAMSLSRPHPEAPYERTGVMLGDEQFAMAQQWERAERLALVGMGVEPGLSDVFARYAADHLFSSITEIGVRDGANLEVDGYAFAPSFSIWTTIEECLNPPVIWERERGWFTTPPFSDPEVFDFPEGIGPGRVRQRRARGGPAHPAVGRRRAGDVQVRARRGVHRGAAGPAQDRARPDDAGAGRRRRGLTARRRRGVPSRSGDAR
jgi:saccharopine dehydrogenase-like NADP-dependent oxidoreductase